MVVHQSLICPTSLPPTQSSPLPINALILLFHHHRHLRHPSTRLQPRSEPGIRARLTPEYIQRYIFHIATTPEHRLGRRPTQVQPKPTSLARHSPPWSGVACWPRGAPWIALSPSPCSPARTPSTARPRVEQPAMDIHEKKQPEHQPPQVQPCRYKVGKTLGAGSYSVVKECVHIDTGRYYAAKVINKRLMAGREHMVRPLARSSRHVFSCQERSLMSVFRNDRSVTKSPSLRRSRWATKTSSPSSTTSRR